MTDTNRWMPYLSMKDSSYSDFSNKKTHWTFVPNQKVYMLTIPFITVRGWVIV
jgi:hypothetical protein